MRITVTGSSLSKDVYDPGVERGRFWEDSMFYLYTMAWDPFILARLDAVPDYREPADPITDPGNTLLLFDRANDEQDAVAIQQVLDSGGHVLLNHPSHELIRQTGETFCDNGFGQTIISLRERWHLKKNVPHPYTYPHTQPFLRLNPDAGQVLSHIGGNPDLILGDRAAIFAGDPIAVMASYQNIPVDCHSLPMIWPSYSFRLLLSLQGFHRANRNNVCSVNRLNYAAIFMRWVLLT